MGGRNLEKNMEEALERNSVLIYGAHLAAVEVYRYIRQRKKDVAFAGFVVTAAKDNPAEIMGETVTELSSCRAPKDAAILIAMPEKYHAEAQAYAEGLGFFSFVKIGLEDLARLKGRQLLRRQEREPDLGFCLYEDPYDTSWLNLSEAPGGPGAEYDLRSEHYKFPTLFYLDEKTVFQEAGRFQFHREYERLFGPYRNLHSLLAAYAPHGDEVDLLRVYMVFSQWDSAKGPRQALPPWVCPLQAGSVLAEHKAGTYLDETGDNISGQNGVLAEMTAAYWIWKNAGPVKYKGLCHYRRHFLLDEREVLGLEDCGVDVILPTPRYAPGGVRQMFLAETPVKEPVWQMLLQAVSDCHPEDRGAVEAALDACLYCPNNMVIAKSEIYDAYCAWIFPVLFRMLELDEVYGYGHEQDRHIAYAAELLTSCFFTLRRDSCRIFVTDYRFMD